MPCWDYAVPTMFEGVPAALRPPVALALAKAVESIPHESALPGVSGHEKLPIGGHENARWGEF
ncbi:hypothetical protein GCM10023346_46560 [Arthrobacter gyeryongensis]|uniref:Uncharacterized protein n=1 Tax=Arthrobacter gyeryongensis TaxID=1650592 RepID=A0ABP9SS31_9MICC